MKYRLYMLYVRTERIKKRFSLRFTPMGRIILLITCIALFFGINVQRTMIYQIFSILAGTLLLSFLITLRFRPSLHVRRFLPATCIAGKEMRYRIVIENRGKTAVKGISFAEEVAPYIPGWQEFDGTREEGEERRNIFDRKMRYYRWLWLVKLGRKVRAALQPLPDIGPESGKEAEVSLTPLRRGNIHLQGYYLSRTDPFGLCRCRAGHNDEINLLVLPRIYAVPQLFFKGSRKYHQGGITAAQDRGDSNEFLTLREYVHGDPIKHVDWKATARTGRPIVKQYRDEYFSRYGLVLDSFTAKKFSKTFEEAVSLAASILLSQDSINSVLDLLFVENECVTCTTGRGLQGHQRMLEILASVTTCRDRPFSQLAALVRSHCALLSGIIIIFVDFNEERKKLLDFLLCHNIPTKAILLTANEEELKKYRAENRGVPLKIIEVNNVEKQIATL